MARYIAVFTGPDRVNPLMFRIGTNAYTSRNPETVEAHIASWDGRQAYHYGITGVLAVRAVPYEQFQQNYNEVPPVVESVEVFTNMLDRLFPRESEAQESPEGRNPELSS